MVVSPRLREVRDECAGEVECGGLIAHGQPSLRRGNHVQPNDRFVECEVIGQLVDKIHVVLVDLICTHIP